VRELLYTISKRYALIVTLDMFRRDLKTFTSDSVYGHQDTD